MIGGFLERVGRDEGETLVTRVPAAQGSRPGLNRTASPRLAAGFGSGSLGEAVTFSLGREPQAAAAGSGAGSLGEAVPFGLGREPQAAAEAAPTARADAPDTPRSRPDRPSTHGPAPALIAFAMRCPASLPPLAAVIAAGFELRAIVVPVTGTGEMDPGQPLDRLASAAGVPLVPVRDRAALRSPATLRRLAALAPDAFVVACFPWRIPAAVIGLAPLGGLNVHPSLLPVSRGPEPLFWTLRRGERRTGVTIHRLDRGLDTGPVVAQAATDVPSGIRAPDLEARLAALGADLLVPALHALAAGTAPAVPQDDALATAAPVPTADDWLIPTNLPAGWAYAFARGVAPLGGPLALLILATGERIPIVDALDFDPFGEQDGPVAGETRHDRHAARDGAVVTVRFRSGTARFLVKP